MNIFTKLLKKSNGQSISDFELQMVRAGVNKCFCGCGKWCKYPGQKYLAGHYNKMKVRKRTKDADTIKLEGHAGSTDEQTKQYLNGEVVEREGKQWKEFPKFWFVDLTAERNEKKLNEARIYLLERKLWYMDEEDWIRFLKFKEKNIEEVPECFGEQYILTPHVNTARDDECKFNYLTWELNPNCPNENEKCKFFSDQGQGTLICNLYHTWKILLQWEKEDEEIRVCRCGCLTRIDEEQRFANDHFLH